MVAPPDRTDQVYRCWWFGINNVRRSHQPHAHVTFPAIAPFLRAEVESFDWPLGGSPGSRRHYDRMRVGDRVVFWMGDGYRPEWGIIGCATIGRVDCPAGPFTLKRWPGSPPTITPYPSGQPARTEQSEFLRGVFGIHYRPLRKLFVRLGYEGVKPCVVTIDEMSPAQFAALLNRASAGAVDQAAVWTTPEELELTGVLTEGAVSRVLVNAYERNPEARRRCIEHHGARCCLCGFSFGVVYGVVAEGYVHVHHLRALSEIGGKYVVDPVEDLRPVCPNCHAVLHLRNPAYSIEEVREFLRQPNPAAPATATVSGT